MKILSKRIKVTLFVAVTVLFALTLLLMNSSKVYCAPSLGGMSVNEQTEKGEKTFFSDTVQPRWLVYGEPIYYVKEDYSLEDVKKGENFANEKEKALSPVDRSYPPDGITVNTGAINQERYFLYAKDSTGVEKKLSPVTADNAWTNEYAANSVEISFKYAVSLPSNMSFNNDSRTMKKLTADLAVPDDDTKVDTGKIMYRTAKTTEELNHAAWSYINLQNENVVLTFEEPTQIMICIIYEIYEKGKNVFQYKYHHCVAQYCLEVAAH